MTNTENQTPVDVDRETLTLRGRGGGDLKKEKQKSLAGIQSEKGTPKPRNLGGRPRRSTLLPLSDQDKVCEGLMDGASLTEVCKPKTMPSVKTVLKWVVRDREGFGESYAQAREIGLLRMEEELIEIADSIDLSGVDPKLANAAVQRDRLRIDTRKWVAAKQNPRRYGESSRLALEGKVEVPSLSVEEAAREVAMLLATAAARKVQAHRESSAADLDGNGRV